MGEMRIILDCKLENIGEVLKQSQQVGIMTAYHTFFITSLVWLPKLSALSNITQTALRRTCTWSS